MTTFLYEIFKKNGLLSSHLANYQPREAQYQMAIKVWKSLQSQTHGLIEAGTGTGKSFGYCLPAAYWAMKEEKRVIISTNTITLQNQLLNKELPLVKKILEEIDEDWEDKFCFELAKGRGNYICKRRLDHYISDSMVEEAPYQSLAAELKSHLHEMKIGDKDDLPFPVPMDFFHEIKADADDCMGKECPFYDSCFFQNARRKLQKAQIIVVNHALFFIDLALRRQGANVLPDYDCVILDEGHRVEEQVTKQYQFTVNLDLINNLFSRFFKNRTHWARAVQDPELKAQVESLHTRLYGQVAALFAPLARNLAGRERTQYLLKREIVDCYPFDSIFKEIVQLIEDKRAFLELEHGENETTIGLGRYIQNICNFDQMFRCVLLRLHPEHLATWVEFTPPGKTPLIKDDDFWAHCLTLHCAPIEVAQILREELFQKKTVIITSATLTAQGNFDFVAERLGIDEYQSFQAASPFNYAEQSLLIIPQNVPAPTDWDFDSYVMAAMKEILLQTHGRTFLLFTSYQQMNKVYKGLKEWLLHHGMKGLLHENGISREKLLIDFKSESNAVLFGCESFWEGVDVPGQDLICVVIAKLPFPVPSEPLVQARTKRMEAQGKNAFSDYMLPFAILRLKQGFGRLIRTRNDKGVVVILDSRIRTKTYGHKIIDSLPDSPLTTNISNIEETLARFQLHRFTK